MSIGMSVDEYWEHDPWLAKDYYEAHMLKIEQKNQELWLQGLYMYNAFGVVLSNAFGGKGSKKQEYMNKPIRITPLTEREKAEEQRKKARALAKQLEMFEAMWNANHSEERSE